MQLHQHSAAALCESQSRVLEDCGQFPRLLVPGSFLQTVQPHQTVLTPTASAATLGPTLRQPIGVWMGGHCLLICRGRQIWHSSKQLFITSRQHHLRGL